MAGTVAMPIAERASLRENDRASMRARKRAAHGRSRWYLVHAPKREQSTCERVRKLIPPVLLDDAFVMRKERWRKHAGDWECYSEDMYQGYFFVATKDVDGLSKELSRLSFPAHIAKGDGRSYAPMAVEVQRWYERMMDDSHTIRTSTGIIVDGQLQLQEGPLLGQEDHVVKVVRQKRMCMVAVGDGASGFEERVPLVVPFKS